MRASLMNLFEIKPDLKTSRTDICHTVEQECRQVWKWEPQNRYLFLVQLLVYFLFATLTAQTTKHG